MSTSERQSERDFNRGWNKCLDKCGELNLPRYNVYPNDPCAECGKQIRGRVVGIMFKYMRIRLCRVCAKKLKKLL